MKLQLKIQLPIGFFLNQIIIPKNGIFDIDPFDCESDPCHLAWLIRDNRDLFGRLDDARCSNGTLFNQLDPDGFNQCLFGLKN